MDRKPRRAELDDAPIEDVADVSEVSPILQLALNLATLAFRFLGSLTRLAIGFVLPKIPQLVPLLLCILVIPLLIFLSLSAGFVVWKTSAVSWEEPVYFQYGDGIPPYADLRLNLAANQPYDVSLHLHVPTVPSNYELGNFMTTLHATTTSNKTIAFVRRPALLLPSSTKPLPFFGKKPVVDLEVILLRKFAMGASRVLARVEVGRRDHWKTLGDGAGRELTVVSAVLRGTIRHRGVRGIFSRFPLFTASIASAAFFGITLAVVGGFLISSMQHFTNYDTPPEDQSASNLAISGEAAELSERPLRRRSSKRKSDLKTEATDHGLADVKPLRHRLSRQHLEDYDDLGHVDQVNL